ncbi:MAG: GNAT family N-acetyltransferase [Clostridia bacterium]|nr:GNAT family N-acetyltransferase [Clostridia bacterium]
MDYIINEIRSADEATLSQIAALWIDSFGDTEEFVFDFYKNMPVHSTVCAVIEGRVASMAVLLSVGEGYYGYAVCTSEKHRGNGLCRAIHNYIREKCISEGREYFVHPASSALCSFYKKMGMTEALSYYEVPVSSRGDLKASRIGAEEYFSIRELYFSGDAYYPWSASALRMMEENGTVFLSAYIDGICCAAALEEETITELCAPDHLTGLACSAFLSHCGTEGKVRFFTSPDHASQCALMSFSGNALYFNLFFE